MSLQAEIQKFIDRDQSYRKEFGHYIAMDDHTKQNLIERKMFKHKKFDLG
jgi:hypothetical protein